MSASLAQTFAALADDTRWSILSTLARQELSASGLATTLPVSRQAIAKHLAVLAGSGLVEPVPHGREIRYRAIGGRLSELATQLDRLGTEWDRRLSTIAGIAESE